MPHVVSDLVRMVKSQGRGLTLGLPLEDTRPVLTVTGGVAYTLRPRMAHGPQLGNTLLWANRQQVLLN